MMLPSIFGERFLDDWMDDDFPFDHEIYGKHAKNLMKTDVKETDAGYEVAVDLPGFKKDEINIDLQDGYLTLTANKGVEKEDKNEHGSYIRRERYTGSMQRTFYVGEEITPEDIHAKFEDGILKLTLPKKEAKQIENKKTIEIEG